MRWALSLMLVTGLLGNAWSFEIATNLGTRYLLPSGHGVLRLPIRQAVRPSVELLAIHQQGCPCLSVVSWERTTLAADGTAWCLVAVTGSDRQGWRKDTGIVVDCRDPADGSSGTIAVTLTLETQAPIRLARQSSTEIAVPGDGRPAAVTVEANPDCPLPWDACSVERNQATPFHVELGASSSRAWTLTVSNSRTVVDKPIGTLVRPTAILVWEQDRLVWQRELQLTSQVPGSVTASPSRLAFVPDEAGNATTALAVEGGDRIDPATVTTLPPLPLSVQRGVGDELVVRITIDPRERAPGGGILRIPTGRGEILEVPYVISVPEADPPTAVTKP